jgi:hypothetical protein
MCPAGRRCAQELNSDNHIEVAMQAAMPSHHRHEYRPLSTPRDSQTGGMAIAGYPQPNPRHMSAYQRRLIPEQLCGRTALISWCQDYRLSCSPAIAAAQQSRLESNPTNGFSEVGYERRLAGSANCKISNAYDRIWKPGPAEQPGIVQAIAAPDHALIKEAGKIQQPGPYRGLSRQNRCRVISEMYGRPHATLWQSFPK